MGEHRSVCCKAEVTVRIRKGGKIVNTCDACGKDCKIYDADPGNRINMIGFSAGYTVSRGNKTAKR